MLLVYYELNLFCSRKISQAMPDPSAIGVVTAGHAAQGIVPSGTFGAGGELSVPRTVRSRHEAGSNLRECRLARPPGVQEPDELSL
jgi:hypothetical protein